MAHPAETAGSLASQMMDPALLAILGITALIAVLWALGRQPPAGPAEPHQIATRETRGRPRIFTLDRPTVVPAQLLSDPTDTIVTSNPGRPARRNAPRPRPQIPGPVPRALPAGYGPIEAGARSLRCGYCFRPASRADAVRHSVRGCGQASHIACLGGNGNRCPGPCVGQAVYGV